MVQSGNLTPNIIDIIFLILKILGIFAVLLIGAIMIIPRIVNTERLWKAKGSIEGIVTASFFGASAIAAFVGLLPIVGAFSVGMAVASTKIIKRVQEYVDKLEIIFAPLFFAIIGAQVNLTGINLDVLILSAVVIAVAISAVDYQRQYF
jgi:Kef-type K+ transport system membrane component KefB